MTTTKNIDTESDVEAQGCDKLSRVAVVKDTSAQVPGWACSHHLYGTWFISRAAVVCDWKHDQAQAYPEYPAKEPDAATVQTWFNEQISWIEIYNTGEQLARIDMTEQEQLWLSSMSRDPHSPRASKYSTVGEAKAQAKVPVLIQDSVLIKSLSSLVTRLVARVLLHNPEDELCVTASRFLLLSKTNTPRIALEGPEASESL